MNAMRVRTVRAGFRNCLELSLARVVCVNRNGGKRLKKESLSHVMASIPTGRPPQSSFLLASFRDPSIGVRVCSDAGNKTLWKLYTRYTTDRGLFICSRSSAHIVIQGPSPNSMSIDFSPVVESVLFAGILPSLFTEVSRIEGVYRLD
jgi:hypothetical protein